MSTEPADPMVTASVSSAGAKREDTVDTTHEIQPLSVQRWYWQDVLYLLAMVVLVVVMAYRFTPNLNGEVAVKMTGCSINFFFAH